MDERTHARYMSDIAYFLSKMEAEPNSGYFIPIALAYNKLEKYDETIAMCKTAVERFPSNCAAKTFLAEAYVYKGFFDQARELLFDVTAEDDNNYKALKLLGIICKEKGDNTEALKYLTGAFIRSPEDEEVRKMIDELGGTLNPGEIYDERMKRQSQNAAESEEDEDLKTYQEIDKRIRNAEIIMADLVSDTTINARNYEEEEEFHSDNPNDYMPLITKHEEEEEESLAGSDDDFLPPVTNIAASEEIEPVDTLSQDEASEDLLSALQDENKSTEISEESNTDDLLSALSSDEASEDLASALQEENKSTEISEESNTDDLLSALSNDEASEDLASALQDKNKSSEVSEESNTDDLLSALSNDEASEDLASALQDKNKSSEVSEESNTDDLLSALSNDEASEDLASALQEENKSTEISEESNTDDLLSALSSDEVSEDLASDVQDENKSSEVSEESNTDDLLSALSSDEASKDLALDEQEKDKSSEQEDTEEDTDINSQIDITDKETENTENNEDIIDNIEDSQDTAENIEEDNNIQNNIETDRETNTNEENNIDESITAADSDIDMEEKELLNKEVPSSFGSMTYDDMIDDDFQYGKIVDESYKDSDNPAIDLGESAPFTQGDIMDEILSAVGMTHEDMADDERINISEKDRKLMRLENFLEKVQHNKESR